MDKKLKLSSKLIIYFVLSVFFVIIIYPIVYTLVSSLKTNSEILTNSVRFFPKNPTLDNYRTLLRSDGLNLPLLLWNSIYYTLINVFTIVTTSAMAGYVFAKSDFPGKKIIFGAFTALLFIKLGTITVYPLFDILNSIHLNQSLWGLILIKTFSINVTYIFLIKSYVTSLPAEIDEAAMIDGCNFFQIFAKINLPLLKPILATIAMMAFNGTWNEYLMPTIFTMSNPNQRTLIVAITALKTSGEAAAQWNIILAGAGISMLPVLAVFLIGNKYMISGLSAGAVKG